MIYGFHIHSDDPQSSIKELKKLGASTLQVFTKSPRFINTKMKNYSDEEIKTYKDSGFHIFVHGSYAINLCTMTKNNKLNPTYITSVVEDLSFLKKVNGKGVVLHVGSCTYIDPKEPLRALTKYLLAIIMTCKKDGIYPKEGGKDDKKEEIYPKILLENRAKAGSLYLSTIEEMKYIWEYAKMNNIDKYIGFCFDTCHAFVTNIILNNKKTIWEDLNFLLSNKMPVGLVHLNDSKSLVSDRHENLLDGVITDVDLLTVTQICVKNKIPMLIERIDTTYEEKDKMVKILKIFNEEKI